MKIKNKKNTIYQAIIIFILCLSIIACLNLYVFLDNYNKIQEEKNSNVISNKFAVLLENDEGVFEESKVSKWPSNGYTYNSSKSNCVDVYGNVIAGILTYNSTTNIATVNTKKSVQCYLYFNKNS